MVTASWTVTVAGERADVLQQIADYSRAAEWWPAVRTASKVTEGPIRVGTVFQTTMDIAGRATPVTWKVKTLQSPQECVVKGKMKARDATSPSGCHAASAHALVHTSQIARLVSWWPAKVSVKVKQKYYLSEGPSPDTTMVRRCWSFSKTSLLR